MNTKKLSEVKTVKEMGDSEEIIITMVDGSIGKIKKRDLYDIVTREQNGLMEANSFIKNVGRVTTDLSELTYTCIGYGNVFINGNSQFAGPFLTLFPRGEATYGVQLIFSYAGHRIWIRGYDTTTESKWGKWRVVSEPISFE